MPKRGNKAAGKKMVTCGDTSSGGSCILVGTYWPEQMRDWIWTKGFYNYPIRAKSEETIPVEQLAQIRELWLYNHKTGRKCFSAEFVRVATKGEPEFDGYPTGKKQHGVGGRYFLFKVTPLARPSKTMRRAPVVVRLADFAHDDDLKAGIQKVFLGGKATEEEKSLLLERLLPSDVCNCGCKRLKTCAKAIQLDLWAESMHRPLNFVLSAFANPANGVTCVYSSKNGALYQGDALAWMKGLPPACVDLVFADPPYSIGKASWDCFHSHEEYLVWCEQWVGEVSRLLTNEGSCYICGFSEILADVKYRTQKFFSGCRWIVWHYRNKANLGNDWGRSHESLLHFRKSRTLRLNVDDIRIPYSAHTLKYPNHPQAETSAYGKRGVRSTAMSQWRPNVRGAKPKDVFDIPTTCNGMGEKTPHPTQKPEELVRKMVLASSHPGELVLDPFSGSGTTAVVAQQLGRKWMACEREPEYNKWAAERLSRTIQRPIEYWITLDRETMQRREALR